jgi:hypothetical protein
MATRQSERFIQIPGLILVPDCGVDVGAGHSC